MTYPPATPEFCPYTSLRLKYAGDTYADDYATLDRIDNRLGYVDGNVEVVSRLANSMKNSASIPMLVNFAKHVIKRYDPNWKGE